MLMSTDPKNSLKLAGHRYYNRARHQVTLYAWRIGANRTLLYTVEIRSEVGYQLKIVGRDGGLNRRTAMRRARENYDSQIIQAALRADERLAA